jgi:hypothetical protein
MKKWMIGTMLLLAIMFIACNNNKSHDNHNLAGKEPKTIEDSLLKDIDDGHIVGMSKMSKLHRTQQAVRRTLDSIAALPAKAQDAAAGYVSQLNELIKELDYADFAMEKWMTEYYQDSLLNNKEQRLLYLRDEKMKVDKMKNAILNGLQKADSILKAK